MLTSEFLMSREWNEALARLFSAQREEQIQLLLDMISDALHADEIMLFHFRDGASPEIVAHRAFSELRENQISDYKNGFYLADPFYLAIERAVENQALSLRDVVDQEEFENSEFYTGHYGDTNLADEICFVLSDGKRGYILLSFARSIDVGRYEEREIASAKALAPLVLAVLAAGIQHSSEFNFLSPPSPEDIKLHEDLKIARRNFGKSILTDREFEVVQMMLRGYPVDMISARLKMAEGTTKVHRRNIYRKLDIKSKSELFSLFIDVVEKIDINLDEDPLRVYNETPSKGVS